MVGVRSGCVRKDNAGAAVTPATHAPSAPAPTSMNFRRVPSSSRRSPSAIPRSSSSSRAVLVSRSGGGRPVSPCKAAPLGARLYPARDGARRRGHARSLQGPREPADPGDPSIPARVGTRRARARTGSSAAVDGRVRALATGPRPGSHHLENPHETPLARLGEAALGMLSRLARDLGIARFAAPSRTLPAAATGYNLASLPFRFPFPTSPT